MNINRIFLGGRLTADVDLRTTESGKSIARFSIAVNRKTKENSVDFINCVAFGKTADFITKYFKKGNAIFCIGELRVDNYEKNGEKKQSVQCFVTEVDFVEKKEKLTETDTYFTDIKEIESELPF